jgi:hypothetical protein
MATKPLAEIVSLKQGVEAKFLKQPGVTGVDVGYKYVKGQPTDEIAIRVMVEKKKKTVPAKEKVPATVGGVKTDVIERTYFLHDAKNTKPVEEIELQFDTGGYDPVKGGISIGPCRVIGGLVHAGTLGAIVKDNATSAPMLLSNYHVMCVDGAWKVGDAMAQPSRVDGGSCPASVVGTLVRAQLTDKADAAVCSLSGRSYSCEIADIGPVSGTNVARGEMAVRKRGRTTGLTYGIVEGVSLSINLDYGGGVTHTLTGQIDVRPDPARNEVWADHGDSGAVLVDNDGKIVGLHMAGSNDGHGVANPIADVLSALDVSICTGMAKPGVKDVFDTKQNKEVDKTQKEKFEKLEVKEVEKPVFEGNPKFSESSAQIGGVMAGNITDHKNPDKQPPDKPVKSDKEKIEFKEQKHESKELKIELKDHKNETKEHTKIEIKELSKDKVEIKEHKPESKEFKIETKEHTKVEFEKPPVLENQKQIFEGGGKQIAEGGGKLAEGGDPFQQNFGAQGLQGATASAQIKHTDKIVEKNVFKEHKNENKEFKVEKFENKNENKIEFKEHKNEFKDIKNENKEFKIEQKEHGKSEFDVNVPKFFEGGDPFQVNTPVAQGLQGASAPAQIKHFDKIVEKHVEKIHPDKNLHKDLKDFTKEGIPDKIPFDKPHPDKQIFEGPNKQIVEGGGKFAEGGDPFQVNVAAGQTQGASAPAASAHKVNIKSELEKIKPEKEFKEIEKIKPEKEHVEKFKPEKEFSKDLHLDKHKVEFEKIFPENPKLLVEGSQNPGLGGDPFKVGSPVAQGGVQGASAEPQAGASASTTKFPKVEFEKQDKFPKVEFEKHDKAHKVEFEKHPKHEIEKIKFEGEKVKFEKELVFDKHKDQFEKIFQEGPKTLVEGGPGFPNQPDPETRISQLEAAVAQLSTFITQGMRPDLGAGALTNEPDQRPAPQSDAKPEPKPEPKADPKPEPKPKKPD